MRRLRAPHDEGKGAEATEQEPPRQQQQQHGREVPDEEEDGRACRRSRSGAGEGGRAQHHRHEPPQPYGAGAAPAALGLPLLPAAPAPAPFYHHPQQQPPEDNGGSEAGEAGEAGEGEPPMVIMDPEPLPRPPLQRGRRCLLPVRLQPGAPIQPQPALHSAATGRRYLFLRCLVREKARVMILLAAVLRPVPTGSAQAAFPCPDMGEAAEDEEEAEARREQGIVWAPSGEKVVVKVTDRRVLAQECALNAAALAAAAAGHHQADAGSTTTAAAATAYASGSGPMVGGLLLENPFDEISALALLQAGLEGEEEEDDEGLAALVHEGQGHISPILDALIDEENVYMVMPYFHGKDLYQKVEAYGKGVCEAKAAAIVRQVALGLLYMKRGHRIAHRDVSLENLMCDARGNVRLIDLGMCVRVPRAPEGTSTGSSSPSSSSSSAAAAAAVRVKLARQPRRGKAMYVCPETALELESDPFAGDVWSLGVVAYVLLTHRPLYADPGDAAFACLLEDRCGELLAHYAGMGITGLTPLAADLIIRMLRPLPEDRLTLEEILAHPWIQHFAPTTNNPTTAGPAATAAATAASIPIPAPAAPSARAAAAGIAVSPPQPAAAAAYTAITSATAAVTAAFGGKGVEGQEEEEDGCGGGMMPPVPVLAPGSTDPPLPWAQEESKDAVVAVAAEDGGCGGSSKRLWAATTAATAQAPSLAVCTAVAGGEGAGNAGGGGGGGGGGGSRNTTPTTPRYYPAGMAAAPAPASASAMAVSSEAPAAASLVPWKQEQQLPPPPQQQQQGEGEGDVCLDMAALLAASASSGAGGR